MFKTTIVNMKEKLNNKKVLILFFFIANAFFYWLFIHTIEVEINATFNKNEAIVVYNAKFPEKFYRNINNIKIYKDNLLVQDIELVNVQKRDDNYVLELKKDVSGVSYNKITVDTNVFSIF